MSLSIVQGWKFYRLSEVLTLDECYAAVERMASRLGPLGDGIDAMQAPEVWTLAESVVYASFLTDVRPGLSVEREIVYVVMWTTERLMATQTSEQPVERRVRDAVQCALHGNAVLMINIRNGDLVEGFKDSFDYLHGSSAQREPDGTPVLVRNLVEILRQHASPRRITFPSPGRRSDPRGWQ